MPGFSASRWLAVAAVTSAVVTLASGALARNGDHAGALKKPAPAAAPYGSAVEALELTPGAWPADSHPISFTAVGDAVYFTARTPAHPFGLYHVGAGSGPPGAPELLHAFEQEPASLVAVGTKLLFVAYDASRGYELWSSDGTASGTRIVVDIQPGPVRGIATIWSSTALMPIEGGVVFLGFDLTRKSQLWFSDGTAENTYPLSDIPTDREWVSQGGPGVMLDGVLHIALDDPVDGTQIWRTDGAPAGTYRVSDFVGSPPPRVRFLTAAAGKLWFVMDGPDSTEELWWSDGTTEGTERIPGFEGGGEITFPAPFVSMSDGILFEAEHPEAGHALLHAWLDREDATDEGLHLREVIDIADTDEWGYITPLGKFRDRFVFARRRPSGAYAIYWTDGHAFGTERLITPDEGYRAEGGVDLAAAMGDRFFVLLHGNGSDGPQLHATDGTSDTETLVAEFPDSPPGVFHSFYVDENHGMTAAGERLFFRVGAGDLGSEPWVSDGTAKGTRLLADLAPDRAGTSPSGALAIPNGPLLLGGTADTRTSATSWTQTPHAFTLYEPISRPSELGVPLNPASAVAFDDSVFGFSRNAAGGWDLIRSGGTVDTTHAIELFPSTSPFEGPYGLTVHGAELFFVRRDWRTIQAGAELWKSDGSLLGTERVLNLVPDAILERHPGELTWFRDHLYYTVNDDDGVLQLMRTDGTQEGTESWFRLLSDGFHQTDDAYLTVVGDRLVFSAQSEVTGGALFATDGTPEGTHAILDVHTTRYGEIVSSGRGDRTLAVSGGRAYFIADANGDDVFDAFVTDGTTTGTHCICETEDAEPWAWPQEFVAYGDGVLFARGTPAEGRELWISDGTPEGTRLLADIVPGPESSSCRPLAQVAGTDLALVSAWTPEHGRELWVTDGTAEGTHLVADVMPGPGGSDPSDVVAHGSFVFFSAVDDRIGREWRRVSFDALGIATTRVDSDDDTWPDVLEQALGTSSDAASSRPHDAALVAGGALSRPQLRLTLRYDRPRSDKLQLSTKIELPADVWLEGEMVVVEIGGIVRAFTLDARGRAVNADGDSLRLRAKRRTGVARRGSAKIQLRMRHSTLAPLLYDEGLGDGADRLRGVARAADIRVVWQGKAHDVPGHDLRFTRVPAKKGKAR